MQIAAFPCFLGARPSFSLNHCYVTHDKQVATLNVIMAHAGLENHHDMYIGMANAALLIHMISSFISLDALPSPAGQ